MKISTEYIKKLIPQWMAEDGLTEWIAEEANSRVKLRWTRDSKKKISSGIRRIFYRDSSINDDGTYHTFLVVMTNPTDTEIIEHKFFKAKPLAQIDALETEETWNKFIGTVSASTFDTPVIGRPVMHKYPFPIFYPPNYGPANRKARCHVCGKIKNVYPCADCGQLTCLTCNDDGKTCIVERPGGCFCMKCESKHPETRSEDEID